MSLLSRSHLLTVACCVGCTSTPHYVDNPSGDCEAGYDGSRSGHNPGDSQYLPDCDPALQREYYRVFAQEDETAYMIPRPDATGLAYGFCEGSDEERSDLFERNGLCVPTANTETVQKINSMTPSDALEIAHLLHERLVFRAAEGSSGWSVVPGLFLDDVVDACNRAAVDLSEAKDACADAKKRVTEKSQDDIGRSYTEAECKQLAPALNELYGIAEP